MSETKVITDQTKTTQTSFKYKILTTILALTLSIGWIFVSKHHLQNYLKDSLFSPNQLKTLDDTVDLIADVGFYAAIYLITSTFSVMIIRLVNHSVNPAISERLQPAEKINELIRSFTQALIIFGCLFLYLMENSSSNIFLTFIESIKKSCGFMLPIWFLSGYLSFWMGNMFELLFKRQLGFRKAGYIIEFVTFAVLLGEINGFKLYKLI